MALQEHKDPMTWDKYEQKFTAGRRDTAFLKAGLAKAERLGRDNNKPLTAYAATLKHKPAPADLAYLEQHIRTVNNDAVPLVVAGWQVLPDSGRRQQMGRLRAWISATYRQAVSDTSERLLTAVRVALQRYLPEEADKQGLYFTTQYYRSTGDSNKAFRAANAEAAYLSGLAPDYFKREDDLILAGFKAGVLSDLQAAMVPESRIDTLMRVNLAKNPGIEHRVSLRTADYLNNVSQAVCKRHDRNKDRALLEQAIRWSSRAMELAGNDRSRWSAYAATEAQLLYRAGQPAQAIAGQEQAIRAAREAGRDATGLEGDLARMRDGKL